MFAVHGAELTPGASEKLLQALLQFVDDRRNVGVALEAIRCICFVGWHAVSFVRTGLGAIVSRLQVTYGHGAGTALSGPVSLLHLRAALLSGGSRGDVWEVMNERAWEAPSIGMLRDDNERDVFD